MSSLGLLIEPQQLADALSGDNAGQLLVIDQSKAEHFLAQHIPGSLHLDFKRLQLGQQPTPGALPSIEQLTEVFSQLGLTADKHVVALDDEGGGWAGRLIWVLDVIGHKHYSYLNGGIHAWLAADLEVESGEATAAQTSDYQITTLNSEVSLTKEQIIARLGADDFAIWDARSYAEYTGEKVIAPRGGHIPGAVNYEWTRGMNKNAQLRINDLNDFRQLLAEMGIDQSKEIATHCQTHHRSGFSYLVGKLLGLNIKAYAGSWAEWGSNPDTPINTGDQP